MSVSGRKRERERTQLHRGRGGAETRDSPASFLRHNSEDAFNFLRLKGDSYITSFARSHISEIDDAVDEIASDLLE